MARLSSPIAFADRRAPPPLPDHCLPPCRSLRVITLRTRRGVLCVHATGVHRGPLRLDDEARRSARARERIEPVTYRVL